MGKSHRLTLAIYKTSSSFPKQELYALTNQIQRAAVSIPTNIAEGCGKDSDAELGRYFKIAMESSSELGYLLLFAHNLSYISDSIYQDLEGSLIEIHKMLNVFIQRLKANH
ncbi:MAG TPA: four helix bundle protein [Anaerolineales bacterium]|nr:four helix bundle protein [Anaerolineales bacterium]